MVPLFFSFQVFLRIGFNVAAFYFLFRMWPVPGGRGEEGAQVMGDPGSLTILGGVGREYVAPCYVSKPECDRVCDRMCM